MTEQKPTAKDLADLTKIHGEGQPLTADELGLTDSQKLDFVYAQALAVAALVEQLTPLIPQVAPLLESAGPLLAGIAGPSSSPMGRIFGSLLR